MKNQSLVTFIQDAEIKTIDFSTKDFKPTSTVLNYLRNSPVHKGTKEGCAEGDCGACTVVLGELDADRKIKYTAVDSCLVFLPMIHGKQLITVENLASGDNNMQKLHPVQQAMVDSNGSQCGFCTPGFILSLFALYKNENRPSRESIEDALTGNLCRCTGYKPILDAAVNACVHDSIDQFTGDEKKIEKLLLKLHEQDSPLLVKAEGQNYSQPKTLDAALQILTQTPDVVIINGSTDVSLRVTKKHELLSNILDLSALTELKQVDKNARRIILGAGLSLEKIKSSVEHELPALYNMLKVFGSRQIRSLATMGGNIGSASPIGDLLPVLMAYNAVVHLQSSHQKREFNIREFITGYRQTKRSPDELIVAVTIPVPEKNNVIRSYKISKRKDLDISTVNGGFGIVLNNGKVQEIVLAYGGMAATTSRAKGAESFLIGKTWDRKTADEASDLIYHEFTPITDARSGDEFRRVAAKNLLIKFWSETKIED